MMKLRSLSTAAKRFSTCAVVIAMSCWANGQLALADNVSAASPDASANQDSPKIDFKNPQQPQLIQSTIITNGSGSRPSNSQSSGFPSASASGFAYAGTTHATANAGESVSRSTVMEGDKEVTVVSAVTPRQEITIRQSSEDGIELQLKPRSRSAKADEANSKKVKIFKAESLEDFKEKHAKLYPILEKYLLSEPQNPVVVAVTGNDAQTLATKQIEQMIDQNAGNSPLQDALRQSLDAIKSAQ